MKDRKPTTRIAIKETVFMWFTSFHYQQEIVPAVVRATPGQFTRPATVSPCPLTGEEAMRLLGAASPLLYVATVLTPATTRHFGFTACRMSFIINDTGGNCE